MAPPHLRYVKPADVRQLLSSGLHAGWRAGSFVDTEEGQALMDMLVPSSLFPAMSSVERAQTVQDLLSAACDSWGEPRGEAARYVLGIAQGWYGRTITDRRGKSARHLGGSGEGFRRKHEHRVLEEVSFDVIRLAGELPYARDVQLRLQLVG